LTLPVSFVPSSSHDVPGHFDQSCSLSEFQLD